MNKTSKLTGVVRVLAQITKIEALMENEAPPSHLVSEFRKLEHELALVEQELDKEEWEIIEEKVFNLLKKREVGL